MASESRKYTETSRNSTKNSDPGRSFGQLQRARRAGKVVMAAFSVIGTVARVITIWLSSTH